MAKEDRGFASMDRSKQRDIASKGGKAAHQKGTAHEWTSDEAREAGRKGGMASHRRKQEQQQSPDGTLDTLQPAQAAKHIDALWDAYLDNLPDSGPRAGQEFDPVAQPTKADKAVP